MKITMKLLSFLGDRQEEIEEIVKKLFNKKNELSLLPVPYSQYNYIKFWEFWTGEIRVICVDLSDYEHEMVIPFKDICDPEKAIERYKEEGKVKAELEQRKIVERTAAAERAKLEEELREFERLRKKFENK